MRLTYTDAQICSILGVESASDEEIARVRARLERRRRKSQITGGLCGIIMIVATIVGLVKLLVPGYHDPLFWMSWVVGGLLCGVAAIAVNIFIADDPAS